MENISVKLKILKQEIPHRNDDPCRSQCRCSVLTCLQCVYKLGYIVFLPQELRYLMLKAPC